MQRLFSWNGKMFIVVKIQYALIGSIIVITFSFFV